MTITLPSTVEKYAESPVFTEGTVPAALLREHSTKVGAWGLIVVRDGALTYTRKGCTPIRLTAGDSAVILPQEPHHVTPGDAVTFQIEFYRQRDTQPGGST
ncbi:DUF1971 domain-containing protein [Tritonibacter horizontis]|uniref:Tellurite resistance protein TehB n=1 Tax=Tritonibacter horizontis TaxID=1768241 RepID=A0A132BZW8_9RHOB|nr:DUF1971 domain-containing protein [Tritonibacter horizontis]KUP93407.1 tellurite resistance protein TehB [Tritonibacter horizontis]